jgi:GT2 family glycosyltransferase
MPDEFGRSQGPEMKTVPIIIPYYRAPEKLERCLAAIRAQTYGKTEVFVRDNSDDNILYTAAINEGLAKFSHSPDFDFVMVLNQDAYLLPNAIEQLVDYMNEDPACGIACPIQLASDLRSVFWGGSLQAFPNGIHDAKPIEHYSMPFPTYWANGAAMMIRTAMVREIGYFDKNLRFVGSDSDYSFTAAARGWKIMVVPDARAEHASGASGESDDLAISIIKAEDMIYFGEKWLTGGLYRSLAHEGPQLTNLTVKFAMDALTRGVEIMKSR